MRVAVFGATGKTGRYVVAALCDRGHQVTALGRDPGRLSGTDPRAGRVVADLENISDTKQSLAGTEAVVSLAHARFIPQLLAALPDSCTRVVATGSTRKFTKLPDPAADAVRHGEAAFLASGRPGFILHPTMIYGAPDERNVNRLIRLVRRWPRAIPLLLPLPDGGRRSVQPVFVDDVVQAAVAAVEAPAGAPTAVIVCGPEPIAYRDMMSTVAAAFGRRLTVLPLPAGPLGAAARAAGRVGLRLPFDAREIARAAEDKAFDPGPLTALLGVRPRRFEEGLRLKIERGWYPHAASGGAPGTL